MRAFLVATFLATGGSAAFAGSPGMTLSGDARMGVVWMQSDKLGTAENGLRLTSRARLKVQFRGGTDGGLRFGADVTLDKDRDRPRGAVLTIGR